MLNGRDIAELFRMSGQIRFPDPQKISLLETIATEYAIGTLRRAADIAKLRKTDEIDTEDIAFVFRRSKLVFEKIKHSEEWLQCSQKEKLRFNWENGSAALRVPKCYRKRAEKVVGLGTLPGSLTQHADEAVLRETFQTILKKNIGLQHGITAGAARMAKMALLEFLYRVLKKANRLRTKKERAARRKKQNPLFQKPKEKTVPGCVQIREAYQILIEAPKDSLVLPLPHYIPLFRSIF
ncbi:MAG: uncharacterized protein A8A55_0888 [Amphiamblys sp. WSBS2006]|nr:MAG: uncharacterized protein A8A55_0888 [Amphiamblys sp. WSBS2006]